MMLGLICLCIFPCLVCIILTIEKEELKERVEILEKHIEKLEVKKDEIGAD